MKDKEIVDLFFERSENAISEATKKYGKYCHYIAYKILWNNEDAEECVNDTFFQAWNTIPPQAPKQLATFLGKITRNLALNRWEQYNTKKRGNGQIPLLLEELHECIPTCDNVEPMVDTLFFEEALNRFLASLPKERRKIFMRRYWYASSIKEIAADFYISESKVKMSLLRSRNELRKFLEKEGIFL